MQDLRCFFPKGKRQPRTSSFKQSGSIPHGGAPYLSNVNVHVQRALLRAERRAQLDERHTGESLTLLIGAAVPSKFASVRSLPSTYSVPRGVSPAATLRD